MSLLYSAHQEFQLAVHAVTVDVQFFSEASSLRPRLGGWLNWNQIEPGIRPRLQAFMKFEPLEALVYQGLLVRLMGAFEWFVHRWIVDSMTALNNNPSKFSDYDTHLLNHNRRHVGRALATVMEPVLFHQLDFDALCEEIGTCTPNAAAVRLSPRAFVASLRMGASNLTEEAFRLLGNDLNWNSIGSNQQLKKLLDTTRTVDAAKMAQERLKGLQVSRNEYAHLGTAVPTMTSQQLRDECTFIALVASLLKDEFEAQFVRYTKRP